MISSFLTEEVFAWFHCASVSACMHMHNFITTYFCSVKCTMHPVPFCATLGREAKKLMQDIFQSKCGHSLSFIFIQERVSNSLGTACFSISSIASNQQNLSIKQLGMLQLIRKLKYLRGKKLEVIQLSNSSVFNNLFPRIAGSNSSNFFHLSPSS